MSKHPVNFVLGSVTPYVYENTDKLTNVLISHTKAYARPLVILLDENGNQIEAEICYISESSIKISTNVGIYYEAYIY